MFGGDGERMRVLDSARSSADEPQRRLEVFFSFFFFFADITFPYNA